MTDQTRVEEFIYHEAQLLDNRDLDAWLQLLTEDVLYWMPLKRGQSEAEVHNSLFFEDLLTLRVRVERLKRPRAFSQQPPSYCQHVLQRPQILAHNDEEIITRTPFIYVETQRDEQFMLAGVVQHELAERNGELAIRRKRIDLVNPDAAFPSIQLFL